MRGLLAVATLGLLLGACSSPSAVKQPPQPHQATAVGGFSTAPGGKPGDWTSQAKDFANSRYSTLKQINTGNVGRLRVAWTFSDGALYGHEGAPLVVDNTMYTVSPFPDRAFALDLTKPGGPIKWTYDPAPSPMAIGKACCDPVLRGWAIADGKLIYNLLDAHVVAVDLKTGKEMWRTKMADVSRGVTMTMSAFVAGDKVYVGNSGGEMGVSGWFAALDMPAGPAARAQQAFALAGAAGRHQDQRQGDIGGGIGDSAGGVGDLKAGSTRGGDVDMVIAHAEIGEDFAARLRHIGKDIGAEQVAEGGQDRVIIAQGRAQFGRGQWRWRIAVGHVEPSAGGGDGVVGQATGDQQVQNRRPPMGLGWSGVIRITSPEASGTPRTRTSDRTLPIWRGGKLTTARTWRPIRVSGV